MGIFGNLFHKKTKGSSTTTPLDEHDLPDILKNEQANVLKSGDVLTCLNFVNIYGSFYRYNIDWESFENILLNPNVVLGSTRVSSYLITLASAFGRGATISRWESYFVEQMKDPYAAASFASNAKRILPEEEFEQVNVKKIQDMILKQDEKIATRLIVKYGNSQEWLNYGFNTQKYGNVSLAELSKAIIDSGQRSDQKLRSIIDFLIGTENYRDTDERYKEINFDGFAKIIAQEGKIDDIIGALSFKDINAGILSSAIMDGNSNFFPANRVRAMLKFMDAIVNCGDVRKLKEIDIDSIASNFKTDVNNDAKIRFESLSKQLAENIQKLDESSMDGSRTLDEEHHNESEVLETTRIPQ